MKKIEVVGPGGRRVIEAKDLPRYEVKGFQAIDTSPAAVPKVDSLIEQVKRIHYNSDLDKFVKEYGINVDLSKFSLVKEKVAMIVEVLEG